MPVLDSYSVMNAGYACLRHDAGSPNAYVDSTALTNGANVSHQHRHSNAMLTTCTEHALSDGNNNLSNESIGERSVLALDWHRQSLHRESFDRTSGTTTSRSSSAADCECGAASFSQAPISNVIGHSLDKEIDGNEGCKDDMSEWMALTESSQHHHHRPSIGSVEQKRKIKATAKRQAKAESTPSMCSCSCYRATRDVNIVGECTPLNAVECASLSSPAVTTSASPGKIIGSAFTRSCTKNTSGTIRQRRNKKQGLSTNSGSSRLNVQSQSLSILGPNQTAMSDTIKSSKSKKRSRSMAKCCSTTDCPINCEPDQLQLLHHSAIGEASSATSGCVRPRTASFKQSTVATDGSWLQFFSRLFVFISLCKLWFVCRMTMKFDRIARLTHSHFRLLLVPIGNLRITFNAQTIICMQSAFKLVQIMTRHHHVIFIIIDTFIIMLKALCR